MRLTWDTIQVNAVAFVKRWQGITSEKQRDQGFIEALLRVFGVEDSRAVGTFQEKTRIEGSTKWIDYLWKSKIAIEMKSKGESLDNAFEQLRQYMQSIEKLAQAVLDARALYPDSSLADLYDPLTMPPELLKAHRALDRAVMQAYGFSVRDMTEESCVAELMKRYREIAEDKTDNLWI